MNSIAKILVVLVVAAAAAGVLVLKNQSARKSPATASLPSAPSPASVATPAPAVKLPRLVDLGADKCVPCKMMAPILEELKQEYAGRMQVEFIDVWKDQDAGKAYGIEAIPTQIFFDAEGKELFRHTGFYGKADILGKWQELGIDLTARETTAQRQ